MSRGPLYTPGEWCRRTTEGWCLSVPVALYQAKAEFFRTLGHPQRIRILELLCERDHAVHEMLAETGVEPSNLSQQLAVLRRTGLVRQHRIGGSVVYSLVVKETGDLLAAARSVLHLVLAQSDDLKRELGGNRRRR